VDEKRISEAKKNIYSIKKIISIVFWYFWGYNIFSTEEYLRNLITLYLVLVYKYGFPAG